MTSTGPSRSGTDDDCKDLAQFEELVDILELCREGGLQGQKKIRGESEEHVGDHKNDSDGVSDFGIERFVVQSPTRLVKND